MSVNTDRIREVLKRDKSETAYACEVVFLNNEDSLQSLTENPTCSYRGRKAYTFLSDVECAAGEVVVASVRRDGRLALTFALVISTEAAENVRDQRMVVSPDTGYVLGVVTYVRYLREQLKLLEQRDKEQAELARLIAVEREKIALEQIAASNPELLSRIKEFQNRFPTEPILRGVNGSSAN